MTKQRLFVAVLLAIDFWAASNSAAQMCCMEPGVLASPVRTNPSLHDRRKEIKTILVIPPTVEMFEFSAGGVREPVDEWATLAKNHIATAVESELQGKGDLVVKHSETVAGEAGSVLRDTWALYDAVESSIIQH